MIPWFSGYGMLNGALSHWFDTSIMHNLSFYPKFLRLLLSSPLYQNSWFLGFGRAAFTISAVFIESRPQVTSHGFVFAQSSKNWATAPFKKGWLSHAGKLVSTNKHKSWNISTGFCFSCYALVLPHMHGGRKHW